MIEADSDFTYPDLAFAGFDLVHECIERLWMACIAHDSAVVHLDREGLADDHLEVHTGVSKDIDFTMSTRKVDTLGEDFSDRKCSSAVLTFTVVTRVCTWSLEGSEGEFLTAAHRDFSS